MIYQRVKGMLDYVGEEAAKFRYIEKCFTEEIKKYGFREIITPVLENTEVFVRSSGEESDIVEKEMYTFTDKGRRSLTLRPEGTAGVVRSFIENKLYARPEPEKLYYFAPMFRYSRPQAGRYRQFYQFGVEVFGDVSPLLVADLIASGDKILKRLGIKDIILKINSIGDFSSREAYADRLRAHFAAHRDGLCEDCRRRLDKNPLRVLDCKADSDHPAVIAAPSIADCLSAEAQEYFRKVRAGLDLLGVKYEADSRLVRGLDYYTDIVFEYIYEGDNVYRGLAAGGGGNYADLVSSFGGPDIPGVGYAMGLERILGIMEEQNLFPALDSGLVVAVIGLDEASKEKSLQVASLLREAGYRCELDYAKTALKPQFRLADRAGAGAIVIIGEEERKNNVLTVKNAKTKNQETIPEENLLAYLKEIENENGI
ncbi:MAG: histidine--tRNA ligase [Bacilli bacterium]|nr:histidine--tRNA ligase [Bacilli bacterium]